jgi:hypothetical protein
MGVGDFPLEGVIGGKRRAVRALQLLSRFDMTPLTIDEVHKEMRKVLRDDDN